MSAPLSTNAASAKPLEMREFITSETPSFAWLEASMRDQARAEHHYMVSMSQMIRSRKRSESERMLTWLLYGCEDESRLAVASHYVLAMRRGILVVMNRSKSGIGECFAAACMLRGRFGLLRNVLGAGVPKAMHWSRPALPNEKCVSSPSDWVEFCCSVDPNYDRFAPGPTAHHAASSLYEVAYLKGTLDWRAAFRIALDFQPGHPDAQRVLAQGDERAAVLRSLVMERSIAVANDAAAAPKPSTPPPARRRMAL